MGAGHGDWFTMWIYHFFIRIRWSVCLQSVQKYDGSILMSILCDVRDLRYVAMRVNKLVHDPTLVPSGRK